MTLTLAPTSLKIGSRASKLALAQVDILIKALQKKHPHIKAEVVPITTSGDMTQASGRPLSDTGNKGLFTKEIEEALLAGDIDCAVHSMKDMPTVLPAGLCIPCYLPREDERDVLFSRHAGGLMDLPQGAVVGTASLRRQALVLAKRPDLKVVVFRGNVDTRLKKLAAGEVDATLLAMAGLNRLGLSHLEKEILSHDVMLPAVAQGAVGVEVRESDTKLQEILTTIHCTATEMQVVAERAFLAVMDGSCKTPLAAFMQLPDPQGRARFDGLAARPDGSEVKYVSMLMEVAHRGDAVRLGTAAGNELKAQLPDDFLL